MRDTLTMMGPAMLAGPIGITLNRASGVLNKLTTLVFGGFAARLLLD